MAKNFKELRAKMSPERQKRIEEKTQKMMLETKLQGALNYMVYDNFEWTTTLTRNEIKILVELLKKDLKG